MPRILYVEDNDDNIYMLLNRLKRQGFDVLIALSAHAMSSDRTQALEAGCDEYDVKPVEWARLLTKIRALLPSEEAS